MGKLYSIVLCVCVTCYCCQLYPQYIIVCTRNYIAGNILGSFTPASLSTFMIILALDNRDLRTLVYYYGPLSCMMSLFTEMPVLNKNPLKTVLFQVGNIRTQ